jgi:hypothetical protein
MGITFSRDELLLLNKALAGPNKSHTWSLATAVQRGEQWKRDAVESALMMVRGGIRRRTPEVKLFVNNHDLDTLVEAANCVNTVGGGAEDMFDYVFRADPRMRTLWNRLTAQLFDYGGPHWRDSVWNDKPKQRAGNAGHGSVLVSLPLGDGRHKLTPMPALTSTMAPLVVAEVNAALARRNMTREAQDRYARTGPSTLYAVVHTKSGTDIATVRTADAAKRVLAKCLPLTDWTQSVRQLRTFMDLDARVSAIVAEEGGFAA